MFRLVVAYQADKPVSLLYAHKPRLLGCSFSFLFFSFLFFSFFLKKNCVGSLLSIVYKPGSLFSFYKIGLFFFRSRFFFLAL